MTGQTLPHLCARTHPHTHTLSISCSNWPIPLLSFIPSIRLSLLTCIPTHRLTHIQLMTIVWLVSADVNKRKKTKECVGEWVEIWGRAEDLRMSGMFRDGAVTPEVSHQAGIFILSIQGRVCPHRLSLKSTTWSSLHRKQSLYLLLWTFFMCSLRPQLRHMVYTSKQV